MAVVQGIKEKVHLPIYDSVSVKPEEQLGKDQKSNTLKFFVDVQGKTKLETNLQAASLLPHYNTFEARAMRVVISDLPPEFPDEPKSQDEEERDVTDKDGKHIQTDGTLVAPPIPAGTKVITGKIELGLSRLMELLENARKDPDQEIDIPASDDGVVLEPKTGADAGIKKAEDVGRILLSVKDLEELIETLGKAAPPKEQIRPNDGAGTIIGKLIYSTVTTFYVGEKIMVQMPTWFFPAGAGVYSEAAKVTAHGEPSPTATFRFAEPIFVDKQQNFRVDMEIPDSDVFKELQKIYGPLLIWVVLDGYMTRDVQ